MKQLRASIGRNGIGRTDVEKLAVIVNDAADTAGPLLERVPVTFKQYTDHTINHSLNLIDLMGRFIPAATKTQLNALELALLMLTALVHDLGMFVTEQEKGEFLDSADFHNFLLETPERVEAIETARREGKESRVRAIQDAALADYFRRRHPQRVRESLARHLPGMLMFRDTDLADYVGVLSESHGWGVYESVNYRRPDETVQKRFESVDPLHSIPVNPRYIACCLRLADIMDFDRSRTPLSIWQTIDFTEARSVAEWLKHLQIKGWTVTDRVVRYHAKCAHTEHLVAVSEFLDLIDRELDECSRLIESEPAEITEKYQLDLHRQVDRSHVRMANPRYIAGAFRFELDYERIMTVLMDRSLYPDPSLCLRELLQNSLDACRNRAALSTTPYDPRITVHDLSSDQDDRRIVFEDNGIGMSLSIVQRYFMKVGRSYYRSPEFNAEREKLRRNGISLEATSRFGIGFLSAFMLADWIEVETSREGHPALKITIEGPTRYFLIEELEGHRQPGTRVTLHLRGGAEVDAAAVMEMFAVNVDAEVVVVGPDAQEISRIPRFAWEVEEITPTKAKWSILQRRSVRQRTSPALERVVIPSVVPLDGDLRGAAWLWLLADDEGRPVPERGFLRVRAGIRARYPNACVRILHDIDDDSFDWLSEVLESSVPSLKEDVLTAEILECLDADDSDDVRLAEELAAEWGDASDNDRQLTLRWMRNDREDHVVNWYEDHDALLRLLSGTDAWSERPIRFSGVLVTPGPDDLALHGVLLPAGVTQWQPMKGHAQRQSMRLNDLTGLRLDCRGTNAPIPAANRLFIPAGQEHEIRRAYLRSVFRHVGSLVGAEPSSGWLGWFDSFDWKTIQEPTFLAACRDEHDTLARILGYPDNEGNAVTHESLLARGIVWLEVPSSTPDRYRMVFASHPSREVDDELQVKIDEILPPLPAM